MASMLTSRPLLLLLWFEGLYMRFGGREGFLDSTRACLLRFFAICSIRRSGSWGMRICGALPEIRWWRRRSLAELLGFLLRYISPPFFSVEGWVLQFLEFLLQFFILILDLWSLVLILMLSSLFFSFFFWEQSLNLVRCYGLVWFRFLWRSCHLELIKNVRWS